MYKKILVVTVLIAVTAVLVFGAFNPTQAMAAEKIGNDSIAGYNLQNHDVVPVDQPNEIAAQGSGGTRFGRQVNDSSNSALPGVQVLPSGELDAEETEALLYMREEEKLAHDVYVTLYDQWGLRIFQNISQSEQTHTDAVKTLLDRYGLSDPASSVVGQFSNPDLQALYTQLVSRGSQSLAEALKVGAAIEEIDILDLQTRLAQTDNPDIQQVFNSLLNASHNHLRSFTLTLNNQTGEVYQAQYLSAEDYLTITSSGLGNGRNGGGMRGRRP